MFSNEYRYDCFQTTCNVPRNYVSTYGHPLFKRFSGRKILLSRGMVRPVMFPSFSASSQESKNTGKPYENLCLCLSRIKFHKIHPPQIVSKITRKRFSELLIFQIFWGRPPRPPAERAPSAPLRLAPSALGGQNPPSRKS